MPTSYGQSWRHEGLDDEQRGGDNRGNGGKGGAIETPGWCAQCWVRPIAMVSSRPGNGSACSNPIMATCNTVGSITIINSHRLLVVVQHKAFPPPASSSSSSSSQGGVSPTTLMHTGGGRINVNVDTYLFANHNLSALGVGGQERDVRLLDVETGVVVWRAKNLPLDPRMSLQ
jgi:hypothetical protein